VRRATKVLLQLWLISCFGPACLAKTIIVTDTEQQPLGAAMVTRSVTGADVVDTSDNGYPKSGFVNSVVPRVTRFTDVNGTVRFEPTDAAGEQILRVRKQGYTDVTISIQDAAADIRVTLSKIADAKELAETKPANLWLAAMHFEWADDPEQAREHFLLHCGFCHQQGSPFMRLSRTEQQWDEILQRMTLYGAMASEDFLDDAAEGLADSYAELNKSIAELPDFEQWDQSLESVTITEWPIGDSFSQMHDFVLHPNGLVYVGDNLMDRIYEVDPATGEYQVYKVPRREADEPGGVLGDRLKTYPKTDNYTGVHSLAISSRDGHIFITPSMQQALLEFDPETKQFQRHEMDEGFYPHTIRTDSKDRVWFTLALSSQVAMFDRQSDSFTYYDLASRGFIEWVSLAVIDWRLEHGFVGSPPDLDWESTGFPMPYGIDVSPLDDAVWVARLYANDIAKIDAATGEVTMIETPFNAPRRLRIDADGSLWIVSFSEGKLAKYDPVAGEFTLYDLPVVSETPYALNVDRERGVVWINGNQSDTIMSFDIESEHWRVFPMSQRRTFTRDIEIDDNGGIYTSNSHFPSWMIEDAQPTLIHIDPGSPVDPGMALYEQHCDTCHSQPEVKAPSLATLQQMPFERIIKSLEFGKMQPQAAALGPDNRLAISKYLSANSSAERDEWIAQNICAPGTAINVQPGDEDNWGFGSGNRRALDSGVSITPESVTDLTLLWSLAIPGATEMRSQPVAADGSLFVGTSNGNVLAIEQQSGCVQWSFKADSTVRSSLNLDATSNGQATLYFADDLGTVYGIVANDGSLRWKRSLRWFPVSVISGSFAFHDDVLFVPISSFETAVAGLDHYPCCRSHGGVVALDGNSGATVWEYHTTPHASKTGVTSAGTDSWGPSGVSVWTTPAVDVERGLIYIGTAQNMSAPATHNSDSVVALDIESGAEQWVFQALAGDVWNVACFMGGANCPENSGPDFDFGGAITLTTRPDGKDVIVAGQKSGQLYVLDPDNEGATLWAERLSMGTSNGGIHWGVATVNNTIWATIADPPRRREGYVPNPGVYALNLSTGEKVWSHPVERGCEFDPADAPGIGLTAMQDAAPKSPWPDCSFYYGHSAAPLFANGVLYAGALDGKLRIFNAADGSLLRVIDTKRSYDADNGVTGHGGAIDLSGLTVAGDRLFVQSGYGMFGQMPGNILLAYTAAAVVSDGD
jgi:virginiamycin B lyase